MVDKVKFRDLETQYSELESRINTAVMDVLASGHFIGGEPVVELEQHLSKYVGAKHCITCGNGTDALQLALMAWGIGPGDAVIVPDFTFFSSGEVVAALGATPVFVDVDERTFNINPSQIEAAYQLAIRNNLSPKVVVAVDLFGLPADYPRLRSICDSLGMLILEDGAQGFGGSIYGKMACSFGDISTTSFFPAKPLGCYGDGGAVFTDDDELASLIRSYAVHGKGEMKYDNVRIGMNSRLDTLQAAILQVKLDEFINSEVDSVNAVADCYNEKLSGLPCALPVAPEGFRSSWAQYTICTSSCREREDLQKVLSEAHIPTMVYYPKPMHDQKAFDGCSLNVDGCPITTNLCSKVLSLPMGPYMTRSDVGHISEVIRSQWRECPQETK